MSKRDKGILESLEDYAEKGICPFHMPGHKRNGALAPYLNRLGAELDVTELPGLDDLHDPHGMLLDAMARTARLYGSKRSFFLVNGSTGGLLAGIRAATKPGDTVLVARNCHKAVYHALELCGLAPVFMQPPIIGDFACAASLPPSMVEEVLQRHPEASLLVFTSPSYEGIISDVETICHIAHQKGIPVLVDEAHGAHLGLDPSFPQGAVSQGADLVVQSFHKTLPSLTQTGVLHANGERVDAGEIARQLGIFQTSSPSYLFLASIDSCTRLLEERGEELFKAWKKRLCNFEAKLSRLQSFACLGYGEKMAVPSVYALDPSKLVIRRKDLALSGVDLMKQLEEEYHIQLEMALESYAVAMTGMGDSNEMLSALADALYDLEQKHPMSGIREDRTVHTALPPTVCSLGKAALMPWKLVSKEQARGAVSGEYIWAYPPGIPLIVPGERMNTEFFIELEQMERAGVRLIGTRGKAPAKVAVLCGED